MRFLAITLMLLAPATAQEPERTFRTCRSCHAMPDPVVSGDDLWIGRIATTACVQPMGPASASKRRALMEWLQGDMAPRPRREDRSRIAADGEGFVLAERFRGSVVLESPSPRGKARRETVRLVWNGETGRSARRSIGAGAWRIRGYRALREDAAGVPWQLWASGGKGRLLEVTAGESSTLHLDLRVHVKARAKRRKDAIRVGLGVTGDSRMGVTIVRNRDRVPAGFVLLGADAREEGRLRYG